MKILQTGFYITAVIQITLNSVLENFNFGR